MLWGISLNIGLGSQVQLRLQKILRSGISESKLYKCQRRVEVKLLSYCQFPLPATEHPSSCLCSPPPQIQSQWFVSGILLSLNFFMSEVEHLLLYKSHLYLFLQHDLNCDLYLKSLHGLACSVGLSINSYAFFSVFKHYYINR